MYILDTSAIRGIKRDLLQEISTRESLAVSTITILELASHLHDSEENEKYLRARGNFLKCKIPETINDPFWLLSEKTKTTANSTRKEEAEILTQLISIVESCSNILDLNKAELIYPDGEKTTCIDAGTRISKILKEDEIQFVQQIQNYSENLGLSGVREADHILTPENLMSCMIGFSDRFSEDPMAKTAVFGSTVMYVGYVISRLYKYANARPRGESDLHIDPNDCEDAYLCLHLDLMSNSVLVTGDTGTIEASRTTMECLNSFLPNNIEQDYVIHINDFIKRTKF